MLTVELGGAGQHPRERQVRLRSVNFMPYHDDVAGAPQNSIIGGASLWVMSGKKPDEYKGVAKFFTFLSKPEVQAEWHQDTGYLPITMAAYEHDARSRASTTRTPAPTSRSSS